MFTLAILAAYLRKDARTAPGMLIAFCYGVDLAFIIVLVALFINFITPGVAWMYDHGVFNEVCNTHPNHSACK